MADITSKSSSVQKAFQSTSGTDEQIMAYYRHIAPVLLPYIKNRPQVLRHLPDEARAELDYFVCNDEAALMNMVGLGHIDIHPRNSTLSSPEHPDWMVLDLKPNAVGTDEVVRTALQAKQVLDSVEVNSYCKTSGTDGLQIYVPLKGRSSYSSTAKFAEYVAQQVHRILPSTTGILKAPSQRRKKVFIDFFQNAPGKALVAPYSFGTRTSSLISTPLEWKEVTPKLDLSSFSMKAVLKRLDKKGDLWKPLLQDETNLHNVLYKLVISR